MQSVYVADFFEDPANLPEGYFEVYLADEVEKLLQTNAATAHARVSELNARIKDLERSLKRCVDAIEYTYGHCYGLPSQLIEASDAAKSLMGSVT